jgi:DNA-binding LacI/PurR family transcriptional regulator
MEEKKTRKKRRNPMENISTHLAGPVEKDSRVIQAELALRRNLRAGSWGTYMPGIRALATTFGVSPATMVKAVDRVRSDGWISNSTARQRFTIHRDVILRHKGKDAMLRTLLLLAPKTGRNETTSSASQVLLHLWELLAPKGWNIRFHIDDYSNGKRRQKQWDELVAHEKPQAVIAILGTPAMAAWARDTKIPTIFCGGAIGEYSVPMVAFSSGKMLEMAMDRLLALGHKQISTMLADRSPEYCQSVQKRIEQKLSNAGVPFIKERHTPTSEIGGVNAFIKSLETTFEQQNTTALICLEWREYLAALCFVQQKGWKVPEDISMICLSSDHAADWLHPVPTHFRLPVITMCEILADWIEDVNLHSNFTLFESLSGKWEEGATIGPVSESTSIP